MKISRKLKSVLVIEGQKEKVNEFIERLKEEVQILSVKVPKKLEKIDTSFIDNNWKIKEYNKIVLYGKLTDTVLIAFGENKTIEKKIKKIIKELAITYRYVKVVSDGNKSKLITQKYNKGEWVEQREENIKTNKYSVARSINI